MTTTRRKVTIGVLMGVLIGFVCGVTYTYPGTAENLTGAKAAGDVIIIHNARHTTAQDTSPSRDTTIEGRSATNLKGGTSFTLGVEAMMPIIGRFITISTLGPAVQ